MLLIAVAALAGIFSALAPCVLPLIPLMLGSHATGGTSRSLRVLAGLALSIIACSILLKSTTLLIDVPVQVWQLIGGGVLMLFSITLVWPHLWQTIVLRSGLEATTNQLGIAAARGPAAIRDILVGASLGPLFNVCSPTYALIVATILPARPAYGMVLLVSYTLGLVTTLYIVAMLGNRFTRKIGWALNPDGLFRRLLGIILLVLGIAIVFGLDKHLQSALTASGAFDWQVFIETQLAQ